MVQMIQLAVEISPRRGSQVQKRPAQELLLNAAGPLTGLLAVGHQLLVHVEMEAHVEGHLLVSDAQPGHLVRAITVTSSSG